MGSKLSLLFPHSLVVNTLLIWLSLFVTIQEISALQFGARGQVCIYSTLPDPTSVWEILSLFGLLLYPFTRLVSGFTPTNTRITCHVAFTILYPCNCFLMKQSVLCLQIFLVKSLYPTWYTMYLFVYTKVLTGLFT